MKFAVYGAGAIGAFMGARLMNAGNEVALIARGPHLEAMRAKGLRIRSQIVGDFECRPPSDGRTRLISARSMPSFWGLRPTA